MNPARRPGDPRADALRERFEGLFPGAGLPVPVAMIAEDLLGLHVEAGPLGASVSGMLLPYERRIVLNEEEPAERRRFTLAHEVGHWVCQCLGMPAAAPILCRSVGPAPRRATEPAEREANVFAADLLMPAAAVRAAAALPVEALAGRFGVSEVAMAWRLFNLGLADRPSA